MTAAVLLEAAALVLLVLVVLGRPWPADESAAAVYVLSDRSASIATDEAQDALADVASHVLDARATVNVRAIDFAGRPDAPRRIGRGAEAGSETVNSRMDRKATNIEGALGLALSSMRAASQAAIVVISDGNATDGDTMRGLQAAADAGVPVLWRTIAPEAASPRIVEVLAPAEARPGQDIPVSVRLAGEATRPLALTLSSRGGSAEPVLAPLAAGPLGTIVLRLRATTPGTLLLDAELSDTAGGRPVDARDNAAVIDVEPPAEILYVAAGPKPLAHSLRAGGWRIESVEPSGLDGRAGGIGRYSAVVLDDVPASAARPETWAALAESVREAGTGILVLGGEQSFAAGSYRESTLEAVLPVVSRPAALGDSAAVAFVVDKSGSMGASSAGVDRFRLAQRAVIETASTLTGRDSAGLVVFDVEARDLLPLQEANAFRQAVSRPWPAQPRGGTRLGPALDAALKQLESASARRRLLVLVTDGFVNEAADPTLQERLSKARVELIALGVGPDADVAALSRLFPQGSSTILHVGEAADLPAMMRQGLEMRRAPIEHGRIVVREQRPLPFLRSAADSWPTVAAYDVTMPAPNAVVYLESERGDPLIAYGQAGLGHVVAVTSGLGAWTPDWLRWRLWPTLAGGLLEWVSSPDVAPGLVASVTDLPQSLRVDVDAASGGKWSDGASGRLRVQHPSRRLEAIPLESSAPGRTSAEIDEPETGLYTFTVEMAGAVRRIVHLREPRRELGAPGPNPDIAAWRSAGLVREWSAADLDKALGAMRPVERRPARAMLLALSLFMLGILVDRARGK
jgi:uncharacterized protein YegL